VGYSFAEGNVVIIAFICFLGATNTVVGVIPVMSALGGYASFLFSVPLVERLQNKKRVLLLSLLVEIVPFFIMGVCGMYVRGWPAIAIVMASILTFQVAGSFSSACFTEILSRIIPVNARGRFFGLWDSVGAAGSLGAIAVATWLLSKQKSGIGYASCFFLAAFALVPAMLLANSVKEPQQARAIRLAAPSLRMYFQRIGIIVQGHANLRKLLIARALGALGASSVPFFTTYSVKVLHLSPSQVGISTSVLIISEMVTMPILGWLGDRMGYLAVMRMGGVVMIAANLISVQARSETGMLVSYALTGLVLASAAVSTMPLMFSFAPTEEEGMSYFMIGTLAIAPCFTLGPLFSGWAADQFGHSAVFAICAGFGLASQLMLMRVRDPSSQCTEETPLPAVPPSLRPNV